PGARWADVTTPEVRAMRLTPPFAPFTDTLEPGVYTVRQQLQANGARLSHFVVHLQDTAASRIALGAAPLVQEFGAQRGVLPRGILEIWPWLIAAAIAVFAV